jgi:hypothetical protein
MTTTYKEIPFYHRMTNQRYYVDWSSVNEVDENRWIPVHLVTLNSKSYVTGGINPNWRSDIRHHRNATTSLDGMRLRYRRSIGHYEIELKAGSVGSILPRRFEAYGSLIYCQIPPAPSFAYAAADNLARQKFYQDASKAIRSFQGLTFAGELRETLKMLRHPAKGLRRGLDDYLKSVQKRTRRAKRSSVKKIVADSWLEHVFGWSPLINDVRSAGQALNDRLNRFSSDYTRVSGSATDEASYENRGQDTEGPYWRVFWDTLTREKITVRYYGEVKREAPYKTRSDMRLLGVSWEDLIPTAWELIPYSFLIDYFTNIGDVLEGWSVHQSDLGWSAKLIRKRAERSSVNHRDSKAYTIANYPSFKSLTRISLSCSQAVCIRTDVNRSPASVPHPSFSWEIPGMGRKWINMSALLASRNKVRRQIFR